jgi:hypothetical protein
MFWRRLDLQRHANSHETTFDKDSTVGKLEQYAKQVEDAGKKMEAAQKSGDQQAQADAMKTMMGAALGSGKVEAVAPDRLKPFLPETLGGRNRSTFSMQRNAAMGMQMTEARATYTSDDGKEWACRSPTPAARRGLHRARGQAGIEAWNSANGYDKTYHAEVGWCMNRIAAARAASTRWCWRSPRSSSRLGPTASTIWRRSPIDLRRTKNEGERGERTMSNVPSHEVVDVPPGGPERCATGSRAGARSWRKRSKGTRQPELNRATCCKVAAYPSPAGAVYPGLEVSGTPSRSRRRRTVGQGRQSSVRVAGGLRLRRYCRVDGSGVTIPGSLDMIRPLRPESDVVEQLFCSAAPAGRDAAGGWRPERHGSRRSNPPPRGCGIGNLRPRPRNALRAGPRAARDRRQDS